MQWYSERARTQANCWNDRIQAHVSPRYSILHRLFWFWIWTLQRERSQPEMRQEYGCLQSIQEHHRKSFEVLALLPLLLEWEDHRWRTERLTWRVWMPNLQLLWLWGVEILKQLSSPSTTRGIRWRWRLSWWWFLARLPAVCSLHLLKLRGNVLDSCCRRHHTIAIERAVALVCGIKSKIFDASLSLSGCEDAVSSADTHLMFRCIWIFWTQFKKTHFLTILEYFSQKDPFLLRN